MKGPLSARQGEPAAAGVAVARAGMLSAFDIATTASEVALVELRRLLAAWHAHEPGARLGHDPEALHQLRITARRIDATLGLFKQQLPMALLRARKTAKTVLRALGAARDLDVQLAELARYCAGLPEHERTAAESSCATRWNPVPACSASPRTRRSERCAACRTNSAHTRTLTCPEIAWPPSPPTPRTGSRPQRSS